MTMTMMPDKLAEIIRHKEQEIEPIRARQDDLRRVALERDDYRGFKTALFKPGEVTVIAEVKKASPSAGVIAEDFDPLLRAIDYEAAGADALSILTDEAFFQGSLDYLRLIRPKVELPLLRKDFMIHPCQIYESVVAGADAILLIVAALSDDELKTLFECARQFPLDVLVEVHNLEEMDRALDLGGDIIGINNRNLKTFQVDLQTTADLAAEIPGDCLGISESGIATAEDVAFCREQGIDCFLVGETLMRSSDLQGTFNQLFCR